MVFKPGESGNPAGRPPDRPVRDALRFVGLREKEGKTAIVRMAEAVFKKAEKGDVPAIKEIADRLDGRPTQAVELSGIDGGPVVLAGERTNDLDCARRASALLEAGGEAMDRIERARAAGEPVDPLDVAAWESARRLAEMFPGPEAAPQIEHSTQPRR